MAGRQNAVMNPIQPTSDASNSPRRSYVLEVFGVLAGIGFFIGVFFAFRTQMSGLVTQREFDRLKPGQTLAEVNDVLGFGGTLCAPATPDANASETRDQSEAAGRRGAVSTYVWENSSISFVRCEFTAGRLITKHARDLP